ncbi:hypothetical protein [Cumulibacter soli]|uniref:hypothetical protein n=1 Tax=Cumulibacter soli TaxID=2546344 RepID=UPI001067BE5F|nr:hypothetical protein [Cumulibacter soli]
MPISAQSPLSRRQVLLASGGLALALAGCTTRAPQEPEPAPPDPLAELIDDHLELAAGYEAAIASAPSDALTGLAQNVQEQISALAGALALRAGDVPSPTPPSDTADPAAALGTVIDLEQTLVTKCGELALTQPAQRAPLLAALSASHQEAVEVLDD